MTDAQQTLFEFRYSMSESELVELFKVVANSPHTNGLGMVYVALGEVVVDSRGLVPSNVNYTHPAVFDE